VSKGYSWDGATGVPDFSWVINASMFHDAIYQFAEDIAREWGCSVWRVLRWGDEIFREVMERDGAPVAGRRIYYAGVRVLGYPFHQLRRLVMFQKIKL